MEFPLRLPSMSEKDRTRASTWAIPKNSPADITALNFPVTKPNVCSGCTETCWLLISYQITHRPEPYEFYFAGEENKGRKSCPRILSHLREYRILEPLVHLVSHSIHSLLSTHHGISLWIIVWVLGRENDREIEKVLLSHFSSQ